MCDTGWLDRLKLGELANRVHSEVKASRKRVEGHEQRQKDVKDRVKAAKQKAPEPEESKAEEGLPAEVVPGAAQELLDLNLAEEEDDSDGAAVLQQVFFPSTVREPSLSFPDDDPLMQSCASALPGLGPDAALHPAVLSRELLLNGSVRAFYQRAPSCPEETLRQLFQNLALSSDESLAGASFAALATLLGRQHPDEAALGMPAGPTYASVLYPCQPSSCTAGWLPGPSDFLDALAAQGYAAPGSGGDASMPDARAWEQPALAARLRNMALLLRLLRLTLPAAEGGQKRLQAVQRDALLELLLALLRLRLDPATCSLAQDLELAAHAAMEALSEKEWERSRAKLAAESAQVGASHRGHLEAVKRIPARGVRGRQLQLHALAALLRSVIPVRKAQAKDVATRELDIPKVLRGLPWFDGGEGAAGLAAGAATPGSGYAHAEVHTALQAAHMLAWAHERAHRRDAFVEGEWLGFLRALQGHFSKLKSGELAALNLLLTTLLNFPAAQQV